MSYVLLFWITFGCYRNLCHLLGKPLYHQPTLLTPLPMVLRCMRYSKLEISLLIHFWVRPEAFSSS